MLREGEGIITREAVTALEKELLQPLAPVPITWYTELEVGVTITVGVLLTSEPTFQVYDKAPRAVNVD